MTTYNDNDDVVRGVMVIASAIFICVVTLAILLATTSCYKAPTYPIPVAIVTPIPGGVRPQCTIPEIPDPPDDVKLTTSEEQPDVEYRVFVHRRDYEKSVQYQKDIAIVLGQVKACLELLTAPP